MDEAPSDDQKLRGVVLRYLALFTIINGPANLSPDLHQLEGTTMRLSIVERFFEAAWAPLERTTFRATWDLISANYKRAAEEWDPIFAGAGVPAEPVQEAQPQLGDLDGLENLVENLCMEPERHVNPDEDTWHRHTFQSDMDEAALEM